MFQDIIVFTVAENLKKSLILNHFSTFVIYKYVLWKVWPKKTLFFLKKNMSQSMVLFMMFVYRCSPEKASFFAFFFCCICWVCCDCPQNWWFSWCWSINAVVEFKREVSSSFSKTTQGFFFAASCRSCQAFFISADSSTSKLPLENLILIHSIWFLKCNQVQGRIFCSQKKSKRTRSSERKISLYVAK